MHSDNSRGMGKGWVKGGHTGYATDGELPALVCGRFLKMVVRGSDGKCLTLFSISIWQL
jgi:hypothetical protein